MRRIAAALAIAALLASTAGAREGKRSDHHRKKGRKRKGSTPVEVTPPMETRTIDGTANNVAQPEWGATEIPFLRLAASDYADGVGTPAGDGRPSARVISNALCAQVSSRESTAGATDLVWQWGQFLDHDIDLTPEAHGGEAFPIAVPVGDPFFDPFATGIATISLTRSYHEFVSGIREQFNEITAYIDASNVYGSDAERASALRTLDGTGRLRTSSGRLLPFNEEGLPNAPSTDASLFLAGDVRANEQAALISMHTLFVREHNYWANRIRRAARSRGGTARVSGSRMSRTDLGLADERQQLSGDEIYELARAIVGAEMQAITYREFLPVLLGPDAIGPYVGYQDDVDASIANEFATAAYRVGHTMLSSTLLRLDRDGETIDAGDLPLLAAFFNPTAVVDDGIEPILRGLCNHVAQNVDPYVIDDVRNFLFGPPGAGGFDLASLNIQRGRDHGLPSYVEMRAALGMSVPTTFSEMSSDPEIVARLEEAYGDITLVDLWAGGLAEDHLEGALVGGTVHRILSDQFRALRDGDRFWYQRQLSAAMVELVEEQTLARIIRRNTRVRRELPDDVWRVE